MITITSKADMNRAVATAAFCPEPPLSERRAIHESGAWRWVATSKNWPEPRSPHDYVPYSGHWEPADFCGDPAASYMLRQKMRERGYKYDQRDRFDGKVTACFRSAHGTGIALHGDECIAEALASLRALGVEFTLSEGWDQR